MTVIVQYVPEVKIWDPNQIIYYFTFECIGLKAFELWAERDDPDNAGNNLREKIPPNYYKVHFYGKGPTYKGGYVSVDVSVVKSNTEFLSIERNTPIYQLADLKNFSPFRMKTLEFTADKLTMIIQELAYRKCGVSITGSTIDQLVPFNPYEPLYIPVIDHVLDKLTDYCLQMDTTGDDCSDDLEGTESNHPSTTNESTTDDDGMLDFS